MKTIEELPRLVPKIPRKLTVFDNGDWMFVTPSNKYTYRKNELTYYQMNFVFGISDQFATNPRITMGRGKIMDYLVVNTTWQIFSIMPKEKFDILFPPKIMDSGASIPRTSKNLSEPGFLESILLEYED